MRRMLTLFYRAKHYRIPIPAMLLGSLGRMGSTNMLPRVIPAKAGISIKQSRIFTFDQLGNRNLDINL
jgi:hypothetical protein